MKRIIYTKNEGACPVRESCMVKGHRNEKKYFMFQQSEINRFSFLSFFLSLYLPTPVSSSLFSSLPLWLLIFISTQRRWYSIIYYLCRKLFKICPQSLYLFNRNSKNPEHLDCIEDWMWLCANCLKNLAIVLFIHLFFIEH